MKLMTKIKNKIFRYIYGQQLYNLYAKEQFSPRKILLFEVHLTDHCNLNCLSCFHFSTLAPSQFLDVGKYRKDLEHLAKLLGGKCNEIRLMGGEPLLHPFLGEICAVSRNCFPKGKIKIVTNALLLKNCDDSFWKNLYDNRISIIITRYPININYNEIEFKAKSMQIKLEYWGKTNDKKQYKIPMDLEGKQNTRKSFYQCHRSNHCTQLRYGKIYPCPIVAYIEFFNKYFNKNLVVSKKDYIDIYKVRNKNQIFDFLCKPIPFCRYCNNNAIVRDIDWSITKKDISEWV